MFPAVRTVVSTDRIVAMRASVIATSTMSAMMSMVPRSRRGNRTSGKRLWRFMSARPPDPVAQGHRRFEHAVAVALPVERRCRARIPRCRHVYEAPDPPGTQIGAGSRGLGAVGGGVAFRPVDARGLLRKRAARDHRDAHRDDAFPLRLPYCLRCDAIRQGR